MTSTDTFSTFSSPTSSTDTFTSLLFSLTWYTLLDMTSVGPTALNDVDTADADDIGCAYC